jgi:4-diphosphocytidyl-2-C-methyl-D-erythritol kinase
MHFTAPAKINLYLGVIAKRDDGFHEIETLFERISLSDDLLIEKTEKSSEIICDHPDVPTDEQSLLGITLSRFKETSGIRDNFRIELTKKIPVSAGLGGGSSDAASLLKGLNKMAGEPLKKQEMLDIGSALGADVAFFIEECSFATGKGRGEIIEPLNSKARLWHLVITPPWGTYTKDIYNKVPAFGLTKKGGIDRMVSAFLEREGGKSLAENLRNDLQAIVLREFPQLKRVFFELESSGAEGVLLSGSGSSVFGIFSEENIESAEERIKGLFSAEEQWRVNKVHTC